jgi:hypothetical protein
MRGAEYDVFWQEHQAAAKNVYVSIRALVALIDNSAPDSDSIWLIGAPAKLFERPWNLPRRARMFRLTLWRFHHLHSSCRNVWRALLEQRRICASAI